MTWHRIVPAILICFSSLSYILNDTMTKLLIDRYHVSSIILLRSLIALPVLYLIHTCTTKQKSIRTKRIDVHALRGVIGLTAAFFYIRSLESLTVSEATVILFLSPIMISCIAWGVLKEKIGLSTWAAVLLCFGGVVVAIQPGTTGFKPAMLFVAAASLLYAINAVCSRHIPPEDNIWSIAFYGAGFSALLIMPIALWHWTPVAPSDALFFCAAACFSSLALGLSAVAYRMASPSFLAPFAYSSLPWSMVVTWVVWQIIPSTEALIGATIILASTTLTVRRSK